ncbi:MAG: glycosyltransferase, partial [Candidatus Omnitrophica bacterium]|nr:glycosyltransferase [Candidatus Omnitrophota bacterium]
KSLVPSMLIFVRPRYSEKVLHPHLRWALWKKKSVFIPNASGIYRACLTDTEKETIKKHYLKKQKRLVVFFGFIYHHKGVELLFEIADPASDQIVIAGEVKDNGYFLRHITNLAYTAPWRDKVTITGFLSTDSLAALLSVADAVILPFRNGAGEWNTSIHAAVLNGAFVITTSLTQRGYDTKHNIYFAKIDDIAEMKSALATYSGTRRDYNAEIDRDEWREIADKHYWLYKEVLS